MKARQKGKQDNKFNFTQEHYTLTETEQERIKLLIEKWKMLFNE